MYKLTHFPFCPFSRSIRLALGECRLTAEYIEQAPRRWPPDPLETDQWDLLPVLETEDGAAVSGAYAISEYLAGKLIKQQEDVRGFAFFPGGDSPQIEVRRLTEWFHRKLSQDVSAPILEEKLYKTLKISWTGDPAPDNRLLHAARINLRHHLAYIGQLAEKNNWLAGDRLSFADLAAAAHLSVVDYLGDVAWEENESAKLWYARIKSRPSFRPLLADKLAWLPPLESYADLDF